MSRGYSHSFTGVLPTSNGDILKKDSFAQLTREKLEYSCKGRSTHPRMLRRLSLAAVSHYDDPFKQRSLNQFKLERSNSLPDQKRLRLLEFDCNSFTRKNELVKTRSVTFHPETICLNAAADNDYEELKDIILNDSVDINYKNSCGLSIIHHAAASGSFECLQFLINNDAEINSFDERGLTPLDLAIRGGFFDCALLLINAGARVERIVNGLQADTA